MVISILFLICLVVLINPTQAQAIVILPPLIAIGLIKLVAIIVGIFSVPAAFLSGVITALNKPKTKSAFLLKTVAYTLLVLSLIALCVGIIFHLYTQKSLFR
jgi:hypothetical protein